jgi:hypothetical protein
MKALRAMIANMRKIGHRVPSVQGLMFQETMNMTSPNGKISCTCSQILPVLGPVDLTTINRTMCQSAVKIKRSAHHRHNAGIIYLVNGHLWSAIGSTSLLCGDNYTSSLLSLFLYRMHSASPRELYFPMATFHNLIEVAWSTDLGFHVWNCMFSRALLAIAPRNGWCRGGDYRYRPCHRSGDQNGSSKENVWREMKMLTTMETDLRMANVPVGVSPPRP